MFDSSMLHSSENRFDLVWNLERMPVDSGESRLEHITKSGERPRNHALDGRMDVPLSI